MLYCLISIFNIADIQFLTYLLYIKIFGIANKNDCFLDSSITKIDAPILRIYRV